MSIIGAIFVTIEDEQANKELPRLHIRQQVPLHLRQRQLPQTRLHLLARPRHQKRVRPLPRQMLKNAVVRIIKHHLLEPQHKNPRDVPTAVRNGESLFLSHQESQGLTPTVQKVDQPVRFQP